MTALDDLNHEIEQAVTEYKAIADRLKALREHRGMLMLEAFYHEHTFELLKIGNEILISQSWADELDRRKDDNGVDAGWVCTVRYINGENLTVGYQYHASNRYDIDFYGMPLLEACKMRKDWLAAKAAR